MYPYRGISQVSQKHCSSENGAFFAMRRRQNKYNMQIYTRHFLPPFSSNWALAGYDLVRTPANALQTIKWEQMQIAIVLCQKNIALTV